MKYTAAVIVLLASPLVSAPPPRLVREIDLTKTVAALPGNALFAILAFSPDEKWLAVAVAPYRREHHKSAGKVDLGPLESLLLVPVDGTAGQQVQVSPGLRPQWNLEWSPDSASVLVEGLANAPLNPPVDAVATLWNLKGDELLRRPAPGIAPGLAWEPPAGGIFGFLDSNHMLARRNPAKGMPDAFETIDLQGQVVDTWTVPKHWQVVDISPARGLLAILTDQAAKTLVVDLPSKKVILTKNNPSGFRGYASGDLNGRWQYFAEGGKTLCSVGSIGTGNPRSDTITECWDVDSGRKIAEFHRFPGGIPAAVSSDASRLVLSRNVAFPSRSDVALIPRGERVVWDFRSGDEIAAWDVPQTAVPLHMLDNVAISASGRYVAETDGTLLRIYALP